MPTFQGNDIARLQPRDENIPFDFEFTIAETEGGEGGLPFGTVISSIIPAITKDDGTAAGDIIQTTILTENVLTLVMSYPTISTEGRYQIRFTVYCSFPAGMIREFDFLRLSIEDVMI